MLLGEVFGLFRCLQMQTLRIAKVVQRKLNLQNEFLEPSTCELQALGEMPVLAAMQEVGLAWAFQSSVLSVFEKRFQVEEMKSMKPEFLEVEASCQIFTMELDSSRVWKDSLNVRLFCFFHAELRRFRLVSDNHVNAQVYKGMVLVTKVQREKVVIFCSCFIAFVLTLIFFFFFFF